MDGWGLDRWVELLALKKAQQSNGYDKILNQPSIYVCGKTTNALTRYVGAFYKGIMSHWHNCNEMCKKYQPTFNLTKQN